MDPLSILQPVFVMVGLTAVVMIFMAVRRTQVLVPQKLPLSQVNTRDGLNRALSGRDNAGNNYMNLFELPVLFYLLVVLALVTDKVTPLLVNLAWGYVGLRVLHTTIHVTYNNVAHRAPIWIVSAFVLFAAWIVFARSVL